MGTSDRRFLTEWYLRNRQRSKMLFDAVAPAAYASQPISLRNPICFYEGHIPAFAANTLLKGALKQPAIDAGFEVLFERGIDPEDEASVNVPPTWPSRDAILDYGRRVDERVLDVLARGDLGDADLPVLQGGQVLQTVLEHEEMHQETVCYLLHRLPQSEKRRPPGSPRSDPGNGPPKPARVTIPAGRAVLGLDPGGPEFGWDNEFPRHEVDVRAFEIDVHDVTNLDYMEFVDAGGYRRAELWDPHAFEWIGRAGVTHPAFWFLRDGQWFWRGLFEDFALPQGWPVYVSQAEATAFARWKKRRLPTEAEHHRAASGTAAGQGNLAFASFDPAPAGSHAAAKSAFGVFDLFSNGWEWTSTVFDGFAGFRPMPAYPRYSADFFDGKHFVLKGASPVTSRSIARPTFRNWFRDTYPFVYATFRCVSS